MSQNPLFKIEFYVPAQQLQQVKQAMFAAGAGKVGDYDSCAWQILGEGQYRPGAASNPFKGRWKRWMNTRWKWSVARRISGAQSPR